MSVNANKLDDVYSDGMECRTESRTVVDGETSKMQWRDHYTIQLTQKFAQLISHNPENKQIRTSFTFKTGGGMEVVWSHTNKKFYCSLDDAVITDFITGEGEERQIWEHFTEFEDIPATHYP
jgi:hypothetical protein